MANLGRFIEVEYRDRKIRYVTEANNWIIWGDNSDGKTFPSYKAAAGFIDRRIAAAKRIKPFACIVSRCSMAFGEHGGRTFTKREVVGVIDEKGVWLKKENECGEATREKQRVDEHTLYEDSAANRESILKIQDIEKQIYQLRGTCGELMSQLTRIDLPSVIAKNQGEAPETGTETKEYEEGNNADKQA